MSNTPELSDEELKQKFNLETAKIAWQELQRHFARGVIILVSQQADLIETAVAISRDQQQNIDAMIQKGELVRANDEHAIRWHEHNTLFWSVVVAPWVLVQEI